MRSTSKNVSLATEAYTIIRRRIVRGQITMGQAVSRRKLAAELGMSFLPVTEALLHLEFEGLLESRPRAGTRVRIPSREDVLGHYAVREALESQAARLFATMATSQERASLLKLAERVDSCVKSNRFLFMGLHAKLHRRIADCTHTVGLSKAIEETHALASTWFCIVPSPMENYSSHQALIQVLSAGTPDAASEMMRDHVTRSLQLTMGRLEPYFKMRKAEGETYSRGTNRPITRRRKPAPALIASPVL